MKKKSRFAKRSGETLSLNENRDGKAWQEERGIRYGIKEITEEGYNIIVDDEKRIVKNLNEKSLKLLKKFDHRTDGRHFPFTVEAENKGHLKWILKKMFPDYTDFILMK